MQVVCVELSAREFLQTEPLTVRHREAVHIVTARVPELGWRIVLNAAPIDHVWGMEMSSSESLKAWRNNQHARRDAPEKLLRWIAGAKVDPAKVAGGILCYWAHPEDPDAFLDHGSDAEEIRFEFTESQIIPDSPESLQHYLRDLGDHIRQLGEYFLMRRGDGTTIAGDKWDDAETSASWLYKIFSETLSASAFGKKPDNANVIETLRAALEFERGFLLERIESEMTPHWLRVEPVHLPIALSFRDRAAGRMMRTAMALDPPNESEEIEISMLRALVLQKAEIPTGCREIAGWALAAPPRSQKEAPILASLSAYLGRCRELYPCLFPKA